MWATSTKYCTAESAGVKDITTQLRTLNVARVLYLAQTGDHDAHADEHETDEDVELAAVEQRRHNRDSQDARVRVVLPAARNDAAQRKSVS